MANDALNRVVEEEFAGRADGILDEGRAAVKQIETDAAEKTERLRTDAEQRRLKRAKEQCTLLLNRAHVDASRTDHRARGTFIDRIIGEIGQALETLAQNGSELTALERMAEEAFDTFVTVARDEGIDPEQTGVTVHLSPGLEPVARRAAQARGLRIDQVAELDRSAGLTVADPGDRVRVTNSFASRLARSHEPLLGMIAAAFTHKK